MNCMTVVYAATSIGSTAPVFTLGSVYSNFVAVRYRGPTSKYIYTSG